MTDLGRTQVRSDDIATIELTLRAKESVLDITIAEGLADIIVTLQRDGLNIPEVAVLSDALLAVATRIRTREKAA